MIESKILGEAVGIQYQGEKDLSETAKINRLSKATFVGRFRRGVMGRPFMVTSDNYQALLGVDNNNPDYTAVSDVFASGVPELMILRIGSTSSSTSGSTSGSTGGSTGGSDSEPENHDITNRKPSYIRLGG